MNRIMSATAGGSRLVILAVAVVLFAAQVHAQEHAQQHAQEHQRVPDAPALTFDFPGMLIGTADYDQGPTGTTVFYFPQGVVAAADVRGGSPGTVNVPAVKLGYETPFIDAVVFSGGSWYGLSAATGVANAIKLRKRAEGKDHVAGVLGAIIYDVGYRRFSRLTPDDALAAAALRDAKPGRFPLGAHGAGRMAMQGYYFARPDKSMDDLAGWPHSGQGGAFRQVGPTKIAVFTVVNALGTIVDRQGRVVRCSRNDPRAKCPLIADLLARKVARLSSAAGAREGPTGNTTITLVVTNQKLSFADLQRLAVQVHTSMGRAIQPFATEEDGDVLYAVTTGKVENPKLSSLDLGVIASEAAWDAVLGSVPDLPGSPATATSAPAARVLERAAGRYAFPDDSHLVVVRNGDSLTATFTKGINGGNMYFEEGRTYRLLPAEGGVFVIDAPARDVIRFDEGPNAVSGLTINPGRWAIAATRVP